MTPNEPTLLDSVRTEQVSVGTMFTQRSYTFVPAAASLIRSVRQATQILRTIRF